MAGEVGPFPSSFDTVPTVPILPADRSPADAPHLIIEPLGSIGRTLDPAVPPRRRAAHAGLHGEPAGVRRGACIATNAGRRPIACLA